MTVIEGSSVKWKEDGLMQVWLYIFLIRKNMDWHFLSHKNIGNIAEKISKITMVVFCVYEYLLIF